MASSVAASGVEASSASPQRVGDVRPYQALVCAIWLGYLIWGAAAHHSSLAHRWPQLLPWIALLALVNLLPIEGWHAHMVPDMPIGVAATLVLSPIEAGIVGFVSALDSKEFQGKLALNHAAFNRAQAGLIYASGSAIVHALAPSTRSPAWILPLALLSLAATYLINCAFVGIGISIEFRHHFVDVFRRLRVGTLTDFGLAFVAWGVLGAMLAALYQAAHFWALLAFIAPTLLGRQVLARSQMFIDTRRAYRSREAALAELSKRIFEERSDERRLIAADLHDEVLQPLFKVTLMAQVLKGDLGHGRLLEMDEDLPELLTAAELASSTLRELIGDLRRSSLGRGGLGQALESLGTSLVERTGVSLETHVEPVSVDPVAELVIYQIAKEALGNAVQHARAAHISIDLAADDRDLRLVIHDDGVGFDTSVERQGHYGLQIMRERAASIGGQLFIDSDPGKGCQVTLVASNNPDSRPTRM